MSSMFRQKPEPPGRRRLRFSFTSTISKSRSSHQAMLKPGSANKRAADQKLDTDQKQQPQHQCRSCVPYDWNCEQTMRSCQTGRSSPSRWRVLYGSWAGLVKRLKQFFSTISRSPSKAALFAADPGPSINPQPQKPVQLENHRRNVTVLPSSRAR